MGSLWVWKLPCAVEAGFQIWHQGSSSLSMVAGASETGKELKLGCVSSKQPLETPKCSNF